MYFKEEYNEYYDVLSQDDDSIDSAVISMQDTMTDVSNQFNSISLMLNEMKGDFSFEMSNGFSSLIEEIEATKGVIDTNLPIAVDSISDLGEKLIELKPEDENYEDTSSRLKNESNKSVSRYEKDEEGNQTDVETNEYLNWQYNINSLKSELNRIIELCERLQTDCDKDIELIEEFNDSVIDLRLKLVAITTSMGGEKIEDVSKMTITQKISYLNRLSDQIKENYNNYKKLYEYYSKDYVLENCGQRDLDAFYDMFTQLVGAESNIPNLDVALKNGNPVTRGNAMIEIIKALTDPEYGVGGK